MSQLIQPILDAVEAVVKAAPLGNLTPFVNVKQGESVPVNFPCAFVIPRRTQFPDSGEGNMRNELHSVTVRLGILGTETLQLTKDCIAYVAAVDGAIQASFPGPMWPNFVLRPFVMEHDFGALFSRQGGGLAYWPEIHLLIGVEELS